MPPPPPSYSSSSGASRGRRILFVHGLAADSRAREVAYEFEKCDIPASRGNSAIAFVEFENPRDAEDAYYELHGKRVGDSTFRIQWAKRPPSRTWGNREEGGRRGRSRSRSPPPRGGQRERSRSPRSPSPRQPQQQRSPSPQPVISDKFVI